MNQTSNMTSARPLLELCSCGTCAERGTSRRGFGANHPRTHSERDEYQRITHPLRVGGGGVPSTSFHHEIASVTHLPGTIHESMNLPHKRSTRDIHLIRICCNTFSIQSSPSPSGLLLVPRRLLTCRRRRSGRILAASGIQSKMRNPRRWMFF